ncbi:MAG: hypothetical protein GY851_06690, partial [bacterium]|nr:hypothetical protein [bacterium]
PALIVLVVLAVLGKVPSYWLTPLVVALVGYTWVQREALAHMNPKMNSRITPSRKTASPGGFGSRRALPAGMGHFVFMSLFGACALGWMMWMLHSEHGLELFAMWIMPGMFLGQCVVRECRFFKTMRLVPVTSGQLLARTARRYYAATGLMTIMAVGVSWALRGTFSWTPVAAVAAGAGAALFVTVWNLKPALDVPFGRSSIVCLWAISMAALVVARAGLFPPEGYYPAAFWVSVYAALVLNPLGLLLLYRAIDRGSSVYVRVERGLSIMGQSVIGGRL